MIRRQSTTLAVNIILAVFTLIVSVDKDRTIFAQGLWIGANLILAVWLSTAADTLEYQNTDLKERLDYRETKYQALWEDFMSLLEALRGPKK